MTTATSIIRAEYGTSRNFLTPDRLRTVLIRHPETGERGAAEISEGTGFAPRGDDRRYPIYGVSVVWETANGGTRRTETDEPFGSRVFQDEPMSEPWPARGQGYADALAYVRSLNGHL